MPTESKTALRPWQQGALVALASLGLALLSIKAWRLSLSVPFEYHWDSLYSQAQIKDILDHGWDLRNSNTGAPYGGQGLDWPEGDSNLNFLVMKVIGIFRGDSASVMNLFWLLSFPATAVSAWAVSRELKVPPWPAMFCGVLFSILPYHFWRGEGHLLLSAYYAVPLACLLILRVLGRESLFTAAKAGQGPRWRRWLTRRSLVTAGICVLLGSSGAYYAAFTVALLLGSCIVTLGRGWLPRTAGAAAAILVIGLTLLVNFSPSLLFRADHGTNNVGVHRSPTDSEYEGLSLTQMLLPRDNHRIGAFASAKAHYRAETIAPSESAQSLGL